MGKSNMFNKVKIEHDKGNYDFQDVKECYYRGWITRKELNEILYKEE